MEKLIYYVAIGRLRKKVLKNLSNPRTPSQLSKSLKTHRSTINQILLDFTKKGLVKPKNPNAPFNVFYQITAKGNKVIKELEKLSE